MAKKGEKLSFEIKEKISKNMKGKKNFLGKRHSIKTKDKISKSQLGKTCWNKGLTKSIDNRIKSCSEEDKEQMRLVGLSNKGKQKSFDHRIKISNTRRKLFNEGKLISPNKGKRLSREYKEKLSKSHIGLMAGKKNHQWLGGISFEPYDKSFNNKFKRSIRKRDNQICMLCGVHREKLKRVLVVHHINYDKLLTISENCISLCLGCHIKTNYNRGHWAKLFQFLLSEKYNYKYSEDNLPIININSQLNAGGKTNA